MGGGRKRRITAITEWMDNQRGDWDLQFNLNMKLSQKKILEVTPRDCLFIFADTIKNNI